MNTYKRVLRDNLPKLFSLYNLDPYSSTYGYGDRLYWGWKVSDFANATMQGGVHALAIAIKLGLIGNIEFTLEVIDSAIKATPKTSPSRRNAKSWTVSAALPRITTGL